MLLPVCALLGAPAMLPAQIPMLIPQMPGEGQAPVTLPDSSAAAQQLRVAANLEKARDWARAAETYQEVIERFSDKLVADQGRAGFVSAPRAAIAALARWPAEGAMVYRGRYEPSARTMLAQAATADERLAVARRYFLTTAAFEASRQAIDEFWRAGQLAQAARLLDELLSLHPDAQPHRPELLYQLGLVQHLLEQTEAARNTLGRLRQLAPAATATIAGRETTLAADLESRLQKAPQRRQSELLDWPMFGGSPSRSALLPFAASFDARLYSLPIPAAAPTEPVRRVRAFTPVAAAPGAAMLPVVDRGQLFLSDGNRVGAFSIDSGGPLPGWPAGWVPVAQTQRGGGLGALAVTTDAVFVVAGGTLAPEWLRAMGQVMEAPSLCRLDRHSGAVTRRFTPGALPERFAALRSVLLSPSLLVADGRLYVAARSGKNTRIEDTYILCLDEATLECRWATYLASGPSGASIIYDDEGPTVSQPEMQVAMDGGRVYAITNVGAIAALDAATGAIDWIQTYERKPQSEPAYRRRTSQTPVRPAWADSPPVLSRGKLFALPSDSLSVLVLDAETGAVEKKLPTASVDGAVALVGADRSELVLASPQSAWCIDWQALAPDAKNLAEATLWNMRFAPGTLGGRPFLTTNSLYLATDRRLLRVNRGKWKIEEAYPSSLAAWPAGEAPGNLVVSASQVVVVSDSSVNVYASLAAAEAQLEAQATAMPAAPEPVLRLAELALSGGRQAVAAERLQRALPLAQDKPGASDRLHATASSTWRSLQADAAKTPPELLEQYRDLSRRSARTPLQRASFCLFAGEVASGKGEPAAALATYQQLLADENARSVLLPRAGRTPQLAWMQAHEAIQKLMRSGGPQVYAALDAEAQRAFAEARGAGAAELLHRAVIRYSSASTAPQAIVDAARLHRSQGRPAAAIDVLRDGQRLYADTPAAIRVLEEMARTYCAMPGRLPVAASRLRLGAETARGAAISEAIEFAGGSLAPGTTFSDAATRIEQASRAAAQAALPDFALATGSASPFGEAQMIPQVRGFLQIEPHDQRDDLLALVTTDNSIAVMRPGGGQLLYKGRIGSGAPLAGCWLDNDLLAWSRDALIAVDTQSAQHRWRTALKALPPLPEPSLIANDVPSLRPPETPAAPLAGRVEAFADVTTAVEQPTAQEQIVAGHASADQLIFATTSGRIASVTAAGGKLRWQHTLAGRPRFVLAGEDYSVVTFEASSPQQLVALDNATGQIVYRVGREPGLQLQNLDLAPGGRLVMSLSGRLCARDLFETGDGLAFDRALAAETFEGMNTPTQLTAISDRVLAITNGGRNLRAFSLQTGNPVAIPAAGLPTGDAVPTFASSATPLILAPEPFVYVCSKSSLAAYNLEQPQQPQRRLPRDATDVRAIAIGRQHVLVFDVPSGPVEAAVPVPIPPPRGDMQRVQRPVKSVRLLAYSRARGNSGEIGRLDIMHTLTHPAGITEWNAVEGGMAFITASGDLHFLPGAARTTAATTPAGGAP